MNRQLALAFALALACPIAAGTHASGRPATSLGGSTVPHQPDLEAIEAEDFADRGSGFLALNGTASGGEGWELDTYGSIQDAISTDAPGIVWFRIYATGSHPEGTINPHLHLYVDGEQRGEWDVRGGWGPYVQTVALFPGRHSVRLENYDNSGDLGKGPAAEREIVLDRLVIETPTLQAVPFLAPGSGFTVPASQVHAARAGQMEDDPTAPSGQAWWEWGVGCFVEMWQATGDLAATITPLVKGSPVNGEGTLVVVREDGATVTTFEVNDSWVQHPVTVSALAGPHVFETCYYNDEPGAKRSLWLDSLAFSAVPAGPAWPSANGGLANLRAPESALTPQSAPNATRAWSYRAAGAVTGTPAIANGTAYFGDGGGKVHAVSLADGREVWSVDHGAPIDSSVAVDGATLLVGDAKGNLAALDRATGRELWRVRADPVDGTHLYGSPVPYQGRVYVGVASEQTLLEWQGEQDFRGSVACFDETDGSLVWRTYTAADGGVGVSVWSTPALDPDLGLLFVGTGNAYAAPAGSLSDAMIALRMDDGSIAWSRQATPNDTFNGRGSPGPDRDLGASPNLFEANGRKLVGEGDKGGVYYALDRATGALVWSASADFREPGATPAQVEGFLGTAAVSGGAIYAPTTARSMVHAFDAATGRTLWSRELGPFPQQYGDRMFGPATATHGVVLQGTSQGRVFLLDAASGAVLANLSAGGAVEGGISVSGDTFLVPDVGPDLWSGKGGVTAFRIGGAGGAPSEEAPGPTGPTGATPTAGTPIIVSRAPDPSVQPGAGAEVNARTPAPPAAWLLAAAAVVALATRRRRPG